MQGITRAPEPALPPERSQQDQAEDDDDDADDEEQDASSEEDEFDARHRRVMAETRAKPAALRPSTQVLESCP